MPLIARRVDRVMLHDQAQSWQDRTGGWELDAGDLTYAFATDFLTDIEITPMNEPYLVPEVTTYDTSLFCPKLGSIVCIAQHEMGDFSWHRLTYRTKKMVDFVNSHYLKFTFNRMNTEKVEQKCRREVTITIEDENHEVVRTWDGSGKSCWSDRGRIDIQGLTEGYICITVGLRLGETDAYFQTRYFEPVRVQPRKDYLRVKITSIDGDVGYLNTRYNQRVKTVDGENYIVGLINGFNGQGGGGGVYGVTAAAYIDISDMWLESDVNPLLYNKHQM